MEKCVCGHAKTEHEKVGVNESACMHEEANGEVECGCMEFKEATAEAASA